ncbi:Serine/threonine-protein kinase RUNKEL (Protein EMBRYO DEFECTIVE 3013) (Protein RUNKEL) [Durusdinium trenchii]|uniref:Serine/threonine-protein kinase RUNKEL (Protein EMBRYO DEFECTIVE 3013) (Protein RUNKEL) n=1 Tax=Durusdinium trenchii TaxID=1381693 RepID=A0ABP0JQP7_9DINO
MAKPGCESIQETQSASCTRNVIEYVNCYETRNHLWVIFEYCAGGDLLRLLKQDGRLPEERVARREHWVAVCGIIFCDLKPGNILFNEDEVLKLGHFAQALRVEEAFPNRTGQPLRRGTPQYMAPELFSEAGVHSFVSDLWSLGCVLHELFSGAQPFISPSSQQLQRLVVDTDLALGLLQPSDRRLTWPSLRQHCWWCGEPLGADNDVARRGEAQALPREPMSVQDLVTEVEQALVEGERLDEDSQAYANLRREAQSLRLENDALGEKVAELEEARKKYIAQEEELTAKLKEDGGFFAFEKDIVEMTGKIQEVDYKIAGLRHKHHHNIKDVGSLKRTMSLIEKRGKVTTLIDKTEEALDRGQVSQAAQLEADLSEVVERLRQESAKIWPKISSYEANIAELSTNMSETQEKLQVVLHTPTREADNLRTHLKGQINQVKRMLAQLGRLRDIQRVNAQEIGMVERERAKLNRYCRVRCLFAVWWCFSFFFGGGCRPQNGRSSNVRLVWTSFCAAGCLRRIDRRR